MALRDFFGFGTGTGPTLNIPTARVDAPPAAPPAAPMMLRADTVGALLGALRNTMTGAGSETDPQTAWVPGVSSRVLWPTELEALDEGTIASIVVREPALWLSCAGIQMDTSIKDDGPMLERFGKLQVNRRFAIAQNKARLLGGAGLVMLPRVPQPLDRPLDPIAAQGLKALVPYGADELRVIELEERLNARKGQPLWYQIDQRRTNDDRDSYWSGRIHWSHVLDFYGHRKLAPKLSMHQWSQWPAISVIQVVWDALRDFYGQRAAAAALGRRASTFIVGFEDYKEKMATDPSGFEALLTLITQTMGADGNFYGPPGATVETASLNLSGQDALARDARIALAAAAGIPSEVFFLSESSSVFAGAGWWKIWTTRLTGAFDENYADNYRRIYELEAPTVYPGADARLTGIKPGDFSAPTDLERMQARVLGAQEVATLQQAGLDITETARRGRYSGPWSPSLPAMEDAPAPALAAPVAPAADAAEDDAPSDTSAAEFAAAMTEHGYTQCRHARTNRCLVCRIERVPLVERGPDGEAVYPVRWRALSG